MTVVHRNIALFALGCVVTLSVVTFLSMRTGFLYRLLPAPQLTDMEQIALAVLQTLTEGRNPGQLCADVSGIDVKVLRHAFAKRGITILDDRKDKACSRWDEYGNKIVTRYKVGKIVIQGDTATASGGYYSGPQASGGSDF